MKLRFPGQWVSLTSTLPVPAVSRWTVGLLWGLLLVGVVDEIRLVLAFPQHAFESGIWSMLADDLQHGQLYRPVFENGSYGGTRYMPLFFTLLAGLTRVVGDPVVAGCLLCQLAVGGMAAAAWAVMREINVPAAYRLPLSGLVICTATYQDAWFTPRCEYLAAALLLLALFCLLRHENGASWWWLVGCGLAVTLAIFAKFTSIIMIAVPALWLLQSGRWKQAVILTFSVGAACLLLATTVQILSKGHFLESLLSTVWGSGSFQRPWSFLRSFWDDETWGDPFMGVILAPAVVGWFLLRGPGLRKGHSSFALFSLVALSETLIIHLTPGIDAHHNILLQATCLVTFGWLLTRGETGTWLVRAGCAACLVMFLVTWFPGVPSVREHEIEWGETTRPRILELLENVPLGANYIANNPMLPLARGERPRAIDLGQGCFLSYWSALTPKPWVGALAPYLPFDLEACWAVGPAAARDFRERAARHEFAAVALTDWQHVLHADMDKPDHPLASAQEEAFWRSQFPAFQELRADYRIVRIRRPYVLLMPRETVATSVATESRVIPVVAAKKSSSQAGRVVQRQ